MRKLLLAMTMGMFSATALGAGEHEGGHQGEQSDAEIDRTIGIEAGEMWFDPETLDIRPGETVEFEITNTGNIEHEFVIGDAQAQEEHRKMMQEMDGHDHAHGHHDMAEGENGGDMPAVTMAPGETVKLVWTAPENLNELEYACNIPGHYESGMSGVFKFQD